MADITKVRMGVCTVTHNGVDLGHTIGGVEVTYEPEYKRVQVDRFSGPAEMILIGEKLMAKVPLAEYTIANLGIAMPKATTGTGKVTIGAQTGKKASTSARLLVLHPISNATADKSEDIGIYKAVVTETVVLGHNNENEKIIEVTFEGLVDEGRTDGNLLGVIGDSTGN